MGGPNLEVVRFGFYMFFPVFMMLKFSDPAWYEDYVKPYGEIIWPPYESTHRPPKSSEELHEELARLKAERLAKKSGVSSTIRQEIPQFTTSAPSSTANSGESSILSALRSTAGSVNEGSSRPSGLDWAGNSGKRLV